MAATAATAEAMVATAEAMVATVVTEATGEQYLILVHSVNYLRISLNKRFLSKSIHIIILQ